MITYIYYAHLASVRYENSVCRGSLLITTYICIYIYIYIYMYIYIISEELETTNQTKHIFFLFLVSGSSYGLKLKLLPVVTPL